MALTNAWVNDNIVSTCIHFLAIVQLLNKLIVDTEVKQATYSFVQKLCTGMLLKLD